MAFIGIITSNKNEETLKKAVVQILQQCEYKHTVIIINKENIDNMKNIKFNSIIINKENNIEQNRKTVLKQILKNAKYLIINSDIHKILDIVSNINITVITYGYNLKATVTTSSINEDRMLLCIQRSIKIEGNTNIEPKEIYTEIIEKDVYNTMAANTVKLLYCWK